jgi:hypothetical protein
MRLLESVIETKGLKTYIDRLSLNMYCTMNLANFSEDGPAGIYTSFSEGNPHSDRNVL